jgi:hypothetical protein
MAPGALCLTLDLSCQSCCMLTAGPSSVCIPTSTASIVLVLPHCIAVDGAV